MCIAVHKPAGVPLTKRTLENCFDSNPDGAGFAFCNPDGTISIQKGYFTFDEFFAAFEPHMAKEALIHFRIATHGDICAANCHPWPITSSDEYSRKFSFAVIHNGILDYPSSKDKSDTGHFVDEILTPHFRRDPDFPFTPEGVFFLKRAIGSTNKLVILRSDGKVAIINDKAGEFVEHPDAEGKQKKVWFSNTSWRVTRTWGGASRGAHFRGYQHDDWDDEYAAYGLSQSTTSGTAKASASGGAPELTTSRFSPDKRADLRHLSRGNRKRLRRSARYWVGMFYAGQQFSELEMIKMLRQECRDLYNIEAPVTDEVVDKIVVSDEFQAVIFDDSIREMMDGAESDPGDDSPEVTGEPTEPEQTEDDTLPEKEEPQKTMHDAVVESASGSV